MVPHLLDRIDGCDGSPGLGVAVIGWEGGRWILRNITVHTLSQGQFPVISCIHTRYRATYVFTYIHMYLVLPSTNIITV